MIPKVHRRGSRVGGLLRYLYGPGRHEEHINPHLVAAWDGASQLPSLEPDLTTAGKRDFRRLTELLEIPVRAGRNPPNRSVWHCSIRTHPTDPTLTDEQWHHVAGEVMARVGLAPRGDDRAVRWVAVRHANDHIHVVATLVRQDRRTAWGRNDFRLSQAACRDLEEQYGLYRVGRPDQGTRTWPTSGELNKASRRGRTVAPREELRRRVREAATVAVDEADFLARLTGDGAVTVRLRHSTHTSGEVTGYAVSLTGDVTASGQPIFHSGGKLAADLSLTRLRTRWQPDTTLAGSDRRARQLRPTRSDVYLRAAQLVSDATGRIARMTAEPGTMAAAADLLSATATSWEGTAGGPLTRAAELFDRVAHESRAHQPARVGTEGRALRTVARMLATTAGRSNDDLQAILRLVDAMAGLASAVADLRAAQLRLHQVHAARMVAAQLAAYEPPALTSSDHRPPSLAPVPPPAMDRWSWRGR